MLQETAQRIHDLIIRDYLPPIVQYVNEKGSPVTVAELTQLFNTNHCQRVYKKGAADGKKCTKLPIEGTNYCKTCTNYLQKKKPQAYGKPFDEEKSLYKLNQYLIFLKKGDISQIIVCGKFEGKKVLPLTKKDVETAISEGYEVNEEYDLSAY